MVGPPSSQVSHLEGWFGRFTSVNTKLISIHHPISGFVPALTVNQTDEPDYQ